MQVQDAKVLVIVGKNERSITLNLKAPLVINLDRRLGRQVVANNDYPVQYELSSEASPAEEDGLSRPRQITPRHPLPCLPSTPA